MKIATTIAGQPYEVKIPEIHLDYDYVDWAALERLCRLAADGSAEALKELAQNLDYESEINRRTTLDLLHVMIDRGMDLRVLYPQLLEAMGLNGIGGCDVRDLLVKMGPAVTDMMIGSLERGEVAFAKNTVEAGNLIGVLARTGTPKAIEFFMHCAQSSDAGQRMKAASFFDDVFQFRPELTTPGMVDAAEHLMTDPDEWVARMAERAMGKHSLNQDIPVIEPSMLASEDPATLMSAMWHLAGREVPVPGTAPGLHRVMLGPAYSDEVGSIRWLAFAALSKIDRANSLTYLRELVQLEQGISDEGLWTIGVIGLNMEESLPMIGEWLEAPEAGLRSAAVALIGEPLHCLYARKFIPKLWELLSGPDESMRLAAIKALLSKAKEFLQLRLIWFEERFALNKAAVEETKQLLLDTLPVLKKVDKKSQAFRAMNMQLHRVIKKIQ